MISVSVTIPKGLPTQQLEKFQDRVVYSMARNTLDYTNSKKHFPYLTGELNRAAMAEGVRSSRTKEYYIGAKGVNYAPTVWEYPQNTNWTNPETYAQWYITEFKYDKDKIVKNAISNALRLIK
jgi:hypothetical protein